MKFYIDYEDFANSRLCGVGVAIIGAAGVGAASTAYGASKAASAQTDAANIASQTSMNMYNTTRNDLEPYRAAGAKALNELQYELPTLTAPINMDEATLQNTPGYQFNLTQGLKATQNAAAARGLGVSGAALKGAATFATGLADNTYQNQFNNANTNNTNAYNRLMGVVQAGQNASVQTGAAGIPAATTSANAQIGAGNAQAAGINATAGAVNNFSNNVAGYAAYQGLYGQSPTSQAGSLPTSPGSYAGGY